MADYQSNDPAKLMMLDNVFPSTGLIGHLALIDGTLLSDEIFTVDAATDTVIFTNSTKLDTGSRIRVNSTSVVPAGLVTGTDYWTIKLSTTQFKLASSPANAIAGIPINITDAGAGTLKANEQTLTSSDSITAVIAHEIRNPAYTSRFPIQNIGDSVIVNGEAQKSPWVQVFSNTSSSTIAIKHLFLIYGGDATIGSTSGYSTTLGIATAIYEQSQDIYAGESKALSITFTR